jgi:hypothetical protein
MAVARDFANADKPAKGTSHLLRSKRSTFCSLE